MNHSSLAAENFSRGYNCAQAVLLAFGDLTGLDEATALSISSSFGGGMGRLREVCGAVSGMFMVAGLLYGESTHLSHEEKAAHYARIQALAAQFREKNGSYLCRELLDGVQVTTGTAPEQRTADYYKKRPCKLLCSDAAELLDRYIAEHPIKR